jgi:hypothetical protein
MQKAGAERTWLVLPEASEVMEVAEARKRQTIKC